MHSVARQAVRFEDVLAKPAHVVFDAEATTSDGGLVLLAAVDRRSCVTDSLAAALRDGRPLGSKNKAPGAAAKAPKAKRAKARKSSWAGLSPEARLARVNAIRVGRGLAPKTAL